MSPATPTDTEGQLRLARAELERALRAGEERRAESLLAAYPAVAQDHEAALELVYTEFVVRQELGQAPSPDEWYARFAQWRDDLSQMFEVHDELCRVEGSRSSRAATLPVAGPGPGLPGRVAGYEILGEIGRGGMGVVYKARQTRLNRTVALKVILSGAFAGPRDLERFRREVEAAARLDHPGVVRVFEVGETHGRPFCVMEYVGGGNLADRMTGTPWPARPAAALVGELARAAHHAHERGIVHRDLKPANVLLQIGDLRSVIGDSQSTPTGPGVESPITDHQSPIVPKITDFGLAKCLLEAAPGPTLPGDVIGTPAYMAPEQAEARGRTVGPPTDVWAIGVILYELLTGRTPFQGDSASETLFQVQSVEPVPPRQFRPRLPRDLETVCLKCLQKEPAARYPTAAALADDLDRWQRGEPIRARPVGRVERLARWCRRNPRVAGLVFLVFLLLAGGSAVFALLWLDARAARAAEQDASRVKDGALRDKDAAIESLEHQRYGAQVAAAGRAVEAGTPEEARRILAETAPRFRNLEWDLLDRMTGQRSFALPTQEMVSLVLHPDGRRVVTVECEPTGVRHECYLIPSDVRQGQPLLRPRGKAGLAIRVLDFPAGTVRTEWASPAKGWIYHVGFAAGGRRLVVVAEDPALSVWDLETGALVHQLPAVARLRRRMVIPPSGEVDLPGYVAALGDDERSVRFWNARTGVEQPSFELPKGYRLRSFIPSPDNQTFSVNAENTDTGAMTRYRGLVGDRDSHRPVAANQGILAYSPTGEWAIAKGAAGDLLTVLDTKSGNEISHLRADGGLPFFGMVMSRDGRLAAALLMEGGVQVWQTNNLPAGPRLFTAAKAASTRFDYRRPVRSFTATDLTGFVSFTDDNRLVVTSRDDRRVTVYDAPGTGCRDRFPAGHVGPPAGPGTLPAVWFHPDGRRLFTAGPSGFDLWDEDADRPVHEDRDPTAPVDGSVLNPAGTRFMIARVPPAPRQLALPKSVAASMQGTLAGGVGFVPGDRLFPPPKPGTTLEGWTVEPVRKEWSVWLPDVRLTAARYGPDGELVTVDRRGTVTVREASTGSVRSELPGPGGVAALATDARTVYWIRAGQPGGATVVVTAAVDGRELRRFAVPECGGDIDGATFLDPRRLLVAVRSADLQVWDVEEDRHLTTVYGTGTQRLSTPTADGKRVVSFGSPHLTFWDTGNWQKLYELPGAPPFWPPRGLAVSPDGRWVAAVGERGLVRVWTTRRPE